MQICNIHERNSTMELTGLHYFMAAAKYGNFSKAARSSYTSQPNISKQISQLEEELDCKLFLRTVSGVELTSAGHYFYQGLQKIVPALERLISETTEISGDTTVSRLRLGICDTMDFERILPGFFPSLLSSQNHGFQIQMETYAVGEIVEKLVVGDLDCILYFSILRTDIPDVKRMAISRSYPKLYFAKNHPLAKKQNLCPSDFSGETFVRASGTLEIKNQYDALPFHPKKILEVNSLSAAFLYIEAGNGVGVFGPSQNRLGYDQICTLELCAGEKVGTDVVWIEKNNNPALHKFIGLLDDYRVLQKEAQGIE